MDQIEVDTFRRCLASRRWRLNNLYKIQDKLGRVVPFVLNEDQRALDEGLHSRNLVVKARQKGITTYACIRALDTALFRANTKCGIVAHTKDDAGKFFRDKILFAYDNLPEWLKAIRQVTQRDMDGTLAFDNGSKVDVSVGHRGGTLQFLHISEYGYMCAFQPQRADEVKTGALNTLAPETIVIIESTARGSYGDFYDKSKEALSLGRMIAAGEGKLTAMDYKAFFLPWFTDPAYQMDPEGVYVSPERERYFAKVEKEMAVSLSARQRAWYVKKLAEQGEAMLREFPSTPDEAFAADTEGSFYGKLMARAELDGRVCDLPIIAGRPVHTFWDIGRNDTNAIWFMQEDGPWFNFIDFYENNGESMEHYARVLKERGYLYGVHYLPHDAKVVEYTRADNLARWQVLEKAGCFPTRVVERIEDIKDGIDMVRQALPRCRFDKNRCGPREGDKLRGGIQALIAYRKEWNEKTETYNERPLHNWASNAADAFRQFAQGYRVTRTQSSDERDQRPRTRRSAAGWKSA